MSTPQRKKQKLQMMSDFATMRFVLKSYKLYQEQKKIKRTPFTRFGKTSIKKTDQVINKSKSYQNIKHKAQQIHIQTPEETTNESDSSFSLKFLDKLSDENILIGNQYQLDMLKIGTIMNNYVDIQYKWSIEPSEPISSLSVQLKYGLIAVGGRKIVEILKYNLKRENDIPKVVVKSTHDEEVLHVRFIRNMGLFIIFQTKVQFHRINIVCENMEINKYSVHKFNYGPNFKLYFVPHAIDNSLNLYFYQNKVKQQQASKFGLWMQMIEVKSNSNNLEVGKPILISCIDIKDRKLFAIYNYSKDLCLLKFQYHIIAIKNGFIIDQCHTNFHNQNSFIQYIQSNRVILHYRNGFIDVYSLSMNMTFKPQRIALQCVDSFEFHSPNKGTLFKIIELKPQTYTVFYQFAPKNIQNNPQINYMLSISNQIDLQQKIDHFYPKTTEIQLSPFEQLQDKCSEAKKFGMTNKEAFYQLWKRSTKNSITDFQILISTKDYVTIENQIQKLLKKQSRSIRQIIKIYFQTLQMLHERVYSPQCTVNSLIQYASCQFLLKKLDMYRYLMKLEHESHIEGQVSQAILINIKDYYQFSDMPVLNQLVDLMNKYLIKKQNFTLIKIKGILLYFRLIFRVNYLETMDRIINTCKLRILQLLQLIPQLLPYLYSDENEGIGIWRSVSEQQKDHNLFLNDLKTLQNKQKVDEFSRHIWFKRNMYTGHGVITIARQKIGQFIQKQNNFEQIFYKFLFRLYNLKTYDQNLKKLILHIETNYPLLPSHLKGKFQLYIILYQMFENFSLQYKLQKFLQLGQFELFKMFFQRQKIEKGGFILKKICPLYEKVLKDGKQIFNQGIYNYFSSSQSSVSDLKCILNKLNNQKNQFHITAQKLYEVLINAIMKKIKIGTQSDTPIDQILVYIQNIPFPIHNESIMDNLQYIQQINYESQILRKIKVNMSLQEIVDHPRKVIEMMVQFEVNRHQIHKIKDYRTLKVYAYKILAEVQCRKSNIYGDKQHIHSLKIFLITVMTNKEMIKICSNLLKDTYLVSQFGIDLFFIEQVVIYLYHWKLLKSHLQQKTHFLAQREYLQTLTELLDEQSEKRKFIQLSIKYAELLTFQDGFKIQYPLFSKENDYPTLNDFLLNLNSLKANQMAQINLQSLFDIIMKLKKLKDSQLEDTLQFSKYEGKLKIQVYQYLIMHLIQVRQLKAAIQNIITLISLPNDYPEFNIIFPVLIIQKLLPELLQNICQLLIKLISYYYYNPLELTMIIKHVFSKPFSNVDLENYFTKKIKEFEKKLILSLNNPIINKKMKIELQSSQQKNQVKNKLVEWCLQRIIDVNTSFIKNYNIHIIFRMMCHNPIIISKYIWCKQEGINVKSIRSLISFMSLQLLFDTDAVLQNGKKIFQIVYLKFNSPITFFSQILKHRQKLPKQLELQNLDEEDQKSNTSIKLIKQCIQLFVEKLNQLKQMHQQIIQKRKNINYHLFVSNPEQYRDRQRTQYIFDDRDDGYQDDGKQLHKKFNFKKNTTSDNKKSERSDTLNKKMSQIKIPTNNRTRKYSEYFPQMVDKLEILRLKNLQNINSEKQLINNEADNDDSNSQIPATSSIEEEQSIQNKSSLKIKNGKLEYFVGQFEENAIPHLQKQNSLEQLNVQQQEKQDLESFLKDNSVISQQISQTKSINQMFQQKKHNNYNIRISIISNTSHVPVNQMAETLLSTATEQSNSFDLGLLRVQARKPAFFNYLKQLLQQIYLDSLVTFERRFSLILAIAHQFQLKHFAPQCIRIFEKISKIKQIQKLPFNLFDTFSIHLILQPTITDAFHSFLKRAIVKINTINIFQIINFVFEVFGKSQFKDELIVEFIVLKIKQSFSDTQKHKKDMLNNILMTLFQYSDKCPQLIEKKCTQLLKGDQTNISIAQTLQKLIQDYRLQTQ